MHSIILNSADRGSCPQEVHIILFLAIKVAVSRHDGGARMVGYAAFTM